MAAEREAARQLRNDEPEHIDPRAMAAEAPAQDPTFRHVAMFAFPGDPDGPAGLTWASAKPSDITLYGGNCFPVRVSLRVVGDKEKP